MKKILLILAIGIISFSSNLILAQQQNGDTKTISGTFKNNQNPMVTSVVFLLRATDSAVVKTVTTDSNGTFNFINVPGGIYRISNQTMGFRPYFSEPIPISDQAVALGTIVLTRIIKQGEKVTIQAKKPMIEVKADKVLVHVDANTSNAGLTALEVLQKSPGVTVDKDGNISLKGNSSVLIYVDGKPTYLSGNDLTTMLSNMQSAQLETIEIMTNPSAKYDAEGNGGIINIKTKKSKTFGFNGSITLNAGIGMTYPRFGESIQLNYKKKKINIFGNFNHSYRERYQHLTIDRKFIAASTNELTSLFSQINEPINTNRDYSSKIGFDYILSKKTTVGAVIKSSYAPSEGQAVGTILLKNTLGILDSTTKSKSTNTALWKNFSTNLNLRHVFDSTGKELNVNVDYIGYDASNKMQLTNAYFIGGSPSSKADTLQGNLPQHIKIFSTKADYSMPINNKINMEAGIKTSYVVTDANAQYDSIMNGMTVNAVSRTNYFKYKENINAAYVNFTKKINEQFSVQTGLRFETTQMKGEEITTAKTFKRNYAQLFPTLFVQYSPNEKNSFVMNYGRRIKRPDYANLNPFVEYLDKYTYEEGNPYLQPQFSHNIELTHTYKSFLSTTLNYTTTNNIIQQVFFTNANKTETAIKLDNIATSKSLGLSVNAALPVNKWFSMNINVVGNYDAFKGMINNKLINQNFSRVAFSLDNQFKLKHGFTANISSFYLTGEMEGVLKIRSLFNTDLGIGKTILKNKGTVRFSLKDVFWSQKPTGYTKYDNVDIDFKQYTNSRLFNLSFTYRFNKGTLKTTNQRKTGGAEEEQNRVSSK